METEDLAKRPSYTYLKWSSHAGTRSTSKGDHVRPAGLLLSFAAIEHDDADTKVVDDVSRAIKLFETHLGISSLAASTPCDCR